MSTATQLAIWLTPYVALGVGILGVGMLVTAFSHWALDHLREGPKHRLFHSLPKRLKECKHYLVEHQYDPVEEGQYLARFNVINVEVGLLLAELRDLGIQIPRFEHADNEADVRFLISYLGAVERLAEHGTLRRARNMTLPTEWVYRELGDGEVHDN